MIKAIPIILCGGSGTRLWPLSRTGFPKQFLCLTGNESLFQQAVQRLAALGNDRIQVGSPVIVSGEEHRFLASEQLREVVIALGTALIESVGRSAGPALSLAALPLCTTAMSLCWSSTLLIKPFPRQRHSPSPCNKPLPKPSRALDLADWQSIDYQRRQSVHLDRKPDHLYTFV